MKQRTEEEILAKTPVVVRLGDEDYPITPLPAIPSKKWREKLVAVLHSTILANDETIPEGADVSTWLKDKLASSISLTMARSPEKLAELIFEYAPALPKDKILDTATDEQLNLAFSQIMQIAFPFFQTLAVMTTLLR
jgi:hypothetical protein